MFELVGWVVDAFAWFGADESRKARKTAKRAGEPPPRRTPLHRFWVVLTTILIVVLIVAIGAELFRRGLLPSK